jgi:nitric oxide reductase NorD protein
MPERDRGLLAIRFETLFSKAEFVAVDRGQDDSEDLAAAARDLEDLDLVSVARERRRTAGRLRVDLDLPAAAHDDLVLADGIRLPEWDYRTRRLLPAHCALQVMLAADAGPAAIPDRLKGTARRLRAQFQVLAPARRWLRGQPDGSEIDMDAALRFVAERRAGGAPERGLYRDLRPVERGLACLLLADLSLSTDAWINNERRVIDVIRDSLFLFSESLAAVGDPFALYGFSSRKRSHVRFHWIKSFDEPHGPLVRGRIAAVRPGYYTRMGAAIRQAGRVLAGQPARRRLLLLLTDGKPNDLDLYEGRYGIEDTRHAVREARELGLECFCVTIDERAGEYLPYLFGANGFVVIRRPSELPRHLPRLYARLTR